MSLGVIDVDAPDDASYVTIEDEEALSNETKHEDILEANKHTPKAHKISHQKDGADEIDLSGLGGQALPVHFNDTIADFTESDTSLHTLDLETLLSETRKIIKVIVNASRISGTGYLDVFPSEGSRYCRIHDASYTATVMIKDGTQRLQYRQTIAGANYRIYCLGYVVEA